MARHKKKKHARSGTEQTVVFPAYTPPTGFETTWDHSIDWETPPNIVLPSNYDGSMWLKLEVKYLSAPSTEDVALWLEQVLTFEIGESLSKLAMRLMKGHRAGFEEFAEAVIEYLMRTRKPKPKKAPKHKQTAKPKETADSQGHSRE